MGASEAERKDWLRTKLVARLWWCGDEVCDCYQPMIERMRPNLAAGYPWITRERVWEGTFDSGGEHLDRLRAELRQAAVIHGITVNDKDYGERLDAGA